MAEIESQHKAKVAELESILEEKDGINKQLDGDLATEKTLKELAESTSAGLQKKYEEEKTNWIDSRGKMENKLNKQQGMFRERIPFDAFGSTQMTMLNAVKSDSKTRDKQIEIIQTLKSIVDPTSAQSLAQGFDTLFKALKNLSDGSMPVFNNEFGQDGGYDGVTDSSFSNNLVNQSVKQFTIYLERIIDLVGKLEESVPVLFMALYKVLELALHGSSSTGTEIVAIR